MKARRSLLAALLAAFAAAAYGCSSETTTSSSTTGGPTTVALDAVMNIVSPLDNACFPVPDGPDATIPITLTFTTTDLKPARVFLRPRGFCSTLSGSICGHLVVKAAPLDGDGDGGAGGATASGGAFDPVNNEGATATVNVLLRKFNNPYQDFRITAELVADDGATLLVARPNAAGIIDRDAGVPLAKSLIVRARMSCSEATSSSSASGSSSASSSSSSASSSSSGSSSSSSSGGGGGGGMGGAASDAGADGG
ncbi:MAG: hypothetical protein ABI134_15515 [Byssovorax sp.]